MNILKTSDLYTLKKLYTLKRSGRPSHKWLGLALISIWFTTIVLGQNFCLPTKKKKKKEKNGKIKSRIFSKFFMKVTYFIFSLKISSSF